MGTGWGNIAVPGALALVTLALLATRTLRADGVAVLALAAAVLLGLVPADRALAGLANPVVTTIGALTILAAAVQRSGLVDLPRAALARRWRLTIPVLLGSGLLVALLAAISGRVGTRAALLRAHRVTAEAAAGRPILMLNLACLLGGAMTVVGSVPNLLVSAIRSDAGDGPFGVLSFLPVGALLLAAGFALFALASTIGGQGAAARTRDPIDQLRRVKNYTTELVVPPGSPLAGKPVAALEAAVENAFHVAALVREGYRRIAARPDWIMHAGDVLVLDCEPSDLHRLMERFDLQPADGPLARLASISGIGLVEAVITQSSDLIGRAAPDSQMGRKLIGPTGIHLLGIGRNDDHPPARLRRTRLRAGDILVLAAEMDTVPQTLAALGCLPLAERRLRLGRRGLAAVPLVILLLALAAAIVPLAPLWLALLAGVLALVLSRAITLREAYEAVPWPGLVMLACLLPLATRLHASAASLAAASALAPYAVAAGPVLLAAAALSVSMVAGALFGSAVAALLLAPFALSLAAAAGASPDMLLMAVATGASIDMLDRAGLIATLVPAPGRRLGPAWTANLAVAAVLLVCGSAAIAGIWHR